MMPQPAPSPLKPISDMPCFEVVKYVQDASDLYPDVAALPVVDDAYAIDRWLMYVVNPHTKRAYLKESTRFRMWLEWQNGRAVANILALPEHDHARAYIFYMLDPTPMPDSILGAYGRKQQPFAAGGLSTESLALSITTLRVMYEAFRKIRVAGNQPYVVFNPFDLIKPSAFEPVEEQDDQLAKSCKVIPLPLWAKLQRYLSDKAAHAPVDASLQRDNWVVNFLYYSWLRRHEIAAAKMGSFSLNEKGIWTIYVKGKGGKIATIPAPKHLMDSLVRYRRSFSLPDYPAQREDVHAVLPLVVKKVGKQRVTSSSIYYLIRRVMRLAALELEGLVHADRALLNDVSPHWLRHSAITHAVHAGASIQTVYSQARHSDIKTTMQIYFHADYEALASELDAANAKNSMHGR